MSFVRFSSSFVAAIALIALFFATGSTAHASQLVAGGNHSCLLRSDRSVVCWGNNDHGQLGDGTRVDRRHPTLVRNLSNVSLISAGHAHTCALLLDGTLKCWGSNGFGQLGDGTAFDKLVPTPVQNLTSVTTISAGFQHTCARTSSPSQGELAFCWGDNQNGEIGNGTAGAPVYVPQFVEGIVGGLISLNAGYAHTCAIMADRTARCWGQNSNGQLGDGTTTDRYVPTPVFGISQLMSISPSGLHTCAITLGHDLYCWGSNNHGQLGIGSQVQQLEPQWVDVLAEPQTVQVGSQHTCAVVHAGAFLDDYVMCWGAGANGRLGNGQGDDRDVPTAIQGLVPLNVVSGFAHSCAKTDNDYGVECWGAGVFGQLGNGDFQDRYQPTPVDFETIFSEAFEIDVP